jgi:hypothetical protein
VAYAEHKIALVMEANDNLSAGVKQAAESSNLLASALGTGVGFGLAGAAVIAAGALARLATSPLEAARGFGALVERTDMGTESFKKWHSAAGQAERQFRVLFGAVGVEGVQAFRQLAAAQREADEAWQAMMAHLSLGLAGPMTGFSMAIDMISRGMTSNPAAFAAMKEAAQVRDTEFRQYAKDGPNVAAIIERITQAEAKRDAQRAKAAADFEHRRRQAEASHLGIEVTAKRPGGKLVSGAGEGFEDFMAEADRFMSRFDNIKNLASAAGASVANSLVTIAANFNNSMQTIGSAAKLFWQNLISDIMAMLARLALRMIGLGLLNLGLGGVPGIIAGAVAHGFGARAGSPRIEGSRAGGGNVYNFNGLNTRDMYMQVALRGGSIARANDLVRLRAEAA